MQPQVTNVISQIMKEQGVSQKLLASRIDLSQTTVSQILSGRIRLNITDLEKIAKSLKTSVLEIITRAVVQKPTSSVMSNEITDLICKTDEHFFIFNFLKVPMSLSELLDKFPNNRRSHVRDALSELTQKNIVAEDVDGRLLSQTGDGTSIYFNGTDSYKSRVRSVYEATRTYTSHIENLTENQFMNWRKFNCDAFYFDYFTNSQVEDQIKLLRKFFEYLRQHHLINNMYSGAEDKTRRLRSITVSHLDFEMAIGRKDEPK